MNALLQLEQLNVSYAGVPTLRDVSLEVHEGEILGIVGESGSGKSTTIHSCMGLLGSDGKVESGDIFFREEDILSMKKEPLRRLRGHDICLIAQNPQDMFHPLQRIRTQLKEYVACHGGISYPEAEKKILEIMEKINLKNGERVLDSYPFELSGGMCQRVAIAFSMVYDPGLLFADEPTSALDVTSQLQVVDELLKIRKEYGTAILIVSHNMGVISYVSDRIAVMFAGLVVEEGRTRDILEKPMHPYTKNLIRAIPKRGEPAPEGIISFPVDRQAQGCPIAEKCSLCRAECRREMPVLQPVGEDHMVRCPYWKENQV